MRRQSIAKTSTCIYGSNPKKHDSNTNFAALVSSTTTSRGRVLYLESAECLTTDALIAARVSPRDLHAVTADETDANTIAIRKPSLRLSREFVSNTLCEQCCTLDKYCGAWLDYCGTPYGRNDKDGRKHRPPLDIRASIELLARNCRRGRTTVLAITAATSRNNPGRKAMIRKYLIEVGFGDLAPKSSTARLLSVHEFLVKVVERYAECFNVTATQVALIKYTRVGNGGMQMTYIAFRLAARK